MFCGIYPLVMPMSTSHGRPDHCALQIIQVLGQRSNNYVENGPLWAYIGLYNSILLVFKEVEGHSILGTLAWSKFSYSLAEEYDSYKNRIK